MIKMLFELFYEDAVIVTQSRKSDGMGGEKVVYEDGEPFKAAFVITSANQNQSAQAVKSNVSCEITTDQLLSFGDVVRRLKDDTYFRILSESKDKSTPATCSFKFNVVNAERWVLPVE